MRNMKVMAEAAIFSPREVNRVPKKSGIVLAPRCCVMILVRLPRIIHASSEPIKAFPSPIQVEAMPKAQPNCPAYPTKMTAEK